MDPAHVLILDQRWLAGRLVDGEDSNAVLATGKDFLAVEIYGVAGPIAYIDGAPVCMDMHGARCLAGANIAGLCQCVFSEDCLGFERAVS